MSNYREVYKDEESYVKHWIYWGIGLSIIVGAFFWLTRTSGSVIDNGIASYQEFQEIYNTCSKLNTDLGVYQSLPENDKMFEQFSKVQRTTAIKTQLNRWVEEYNGKSKMWMKSMWKSNSLPYQLSVNDFSNYK